MTVLVVDDAPANRLILRTLLQRSGHDVSVAADAAEACRLFETGRFGAVLTDFHLGEGDDGVALATSLRRLPNGACARIALMSADGGVSAAPGGLFDAILEKPVSVDAFNRFFGGGRMMKESIRTWLTEQFGADEELFAELYGQYAADMKKLAAELDGLLASGALADIGEKGHAMKGMALQIGDGELAEPCMKLQNAGRAGNLEDCASLIPSVSALVAAL